MQGSLRTGPYEHLAVAFTALMTLPGIPLDLGAAVDPLRARA